jgi:tetratricopeptide (TPR) repeat protein
VGAWFDSILVRTEDADAVRQVLIRAADETGCKFFLGPPVRGWVSFFPENKLGEMEDLMPEIARQLRHDIFRLAVADDDAFLYYFYRAGELVDQYNSSPFSFDEISDEEKELLRGRPELFQDLLAKPGSFGKLKALLEADHEKFIFESERLAEFTELLGLSNTSCSYDNLERAEDAAEVEDFDIEGWDKFIHIEPPPDPTGEREKRRNARRAGDFSPERSAWAYNVIGNTKKKQGDFDGALTDYEKAIELHPQSAEAYNNRAGIKRAKGRLDEALADYNKAIELDPALGVAYGNRGLVRKARGDSASALADYDKAIELNPDLVRVYNNRGELRRANGDLDGALADYNKAIELDPNYAAAFNNRGEWKRGKGDLDGALADYNQALQLNPSFFASYNNRALTKRLKNDLDGALADLNKAIELKPGVAQLYSNRGDVKRIKGNFDDALIDYNRAIELKPDWADAYNNRAEAKRAKRDWDGALADYNRALELKPDFFPSYHNRGLLKRTQGDLDGALADYDKALAIKPDLAGTRALREDAMRAKAALTKPAAPTPTAVRKKIPPTENALALRTDFSDESAWKSLCAGIQNPDNEFTANVDFISDPQFKDVMAEQLPTHLSEGYPFSFAFIIDHTALTKPDHPILVVDLQDEPGRSFRVIVSEMGAVENNLSIANMGFNEFAEVADQAGIFRGF